MTRAVAVFLFLGLCQAAILTIGALALRAGVTGEVGLVDLLLLLVTAVQLPLLYFMLQHGRRRVVAAVLAVCFAFVVSVSFMATAIRAAAVTDNSSVFTFARSTAFASSNRDMMQNYSPAGASTTCGSNGGWTCTFSSDQFSDGQQLSAGTAQTDLYLQESAATPAFKAESHQAAINSTSCTQAVPTGTMLGDVLILTIAFTDGGSFTVTPTAAGWTQIRRTDNGATIGVVWYWRVYQAGDPTSFSVTFSAQTRCLGILAAYSGVDATTPIDVENGQTTASSTTHAAPSVTTNSTNRLVVTTHVVHSVATWTPPSGMTERVDYSNNGSGQAVESIELSDALQPAAGATGAKTATATVGDIGIAQIATLRPALSCDVTATLRHVVAPLYRSTASAVVNNGGTLTINKPTGVVQNDVMIASIAASVAPTTPSGWTRLDQRSNGTISLYTYQRVAGVSEAASYSWTLSAGAYGVGGINAYYNADPNTPIDVNANTGTASGTSHATPSVTTTQSDDILVASFALAANDTWTPPTGMTERVDAVTTTTFIALEVNDTVTNTVGTQGPFAATASPTAASAITSLIALRPLVRTVGSATTTLTSPFGPALVSLNFSGTAETFAAGDRIQFEASAPGSCNASLSYDGASQPSKLTVAAMTIPEAVGALALLAPALPLLWRRRRG